jgi:hypothetical protein
MYDFQYSSETREAFPALRHFFFPKFDDYLTGLIAPKIPKTPPEFTCVADSFKKNLCGVISTASMPFRITSTNHSHRVFHQLLTAERIRTLKPQFKNKSERERSEMAYNAARQQFHEAMTSAEQRPDHHLAILTDLGGLLMEQEMVSAAAELMRQAEALTWGTLEVLGNDLFINLLNTKPKLTEALMHDERTKKRLHVRDIAGALTAYSYDLSQHMGDVLHGISKIDDIETLRDIYDVLMPDNAELLKLLTDSELWKLNQRRNLILHRRSVVDKPYLENTGDILPVGSELIITPEQLERDMLLVLEVGSSMLQSLQTILQA